jgi:hypothetical protein
VTKREAEDDFRQLYMPGLLKAEARSNGSIDRAGRRQEWDFYVDALCKDGRITDHQFHSWLRPRWLLTKPTPNELLLASALAGVAP